ncbi:uncharacterized protein LOC119638236 [Glossina fuscipes]|uniref:Uncharacterized protein LOC119638236 n=1 Tax=Glossina fuscipes TaxID=7396 RepID=A0A9C5Z6K3_9MUSC|nr:uncharacterized protein LOC119638236 [Glossina fuscipes]
MLIVFNQYSASVSITEKTITKTYLIDKVLKLLTKWDHSTNLNINIKFSALLSEFLIKQNERYFESTRYEQQVFYQILQKLNHIIQRKGNEPDFTETHKKILENIFQKNVLLTPPQLKEHYIITDLEYRSLIKHYDKLITVGYPNDTMSDQCLAHIVTLNDDCKLSDECLSIITSDLPTYGYRRVHQILILYVFLHHMCSNISAAPLAYEILASQQCTQVQREQNVLHHLGLPDTYRDLYLEQLVVCGLFGYVEFINWHNVVSVSNWPQEDECLCLFVDGERLIDCNCNNHINSLLLVYYINAVLMLN